MAATATDHTADSFPAQPPLLTVARIQEAADYYTVVFLQSARLYRLPKNNPLAKPMLSLLTESAKKGMAVRVFLTEFHGDVIDNVLRPGTAARKVNHRPRKPPGQ